MFTLRSESGDNLLWIIWCDGMTHLSIFIGWGSNPGVNVGNVTGWANNLGGTSVNDGLAATRAGLGISIDLDAMRRNRKGGITVNLGIFDVLCFVINLYFFFFCTCLCWSDSRWQRTEESSGFVQYSDCCQYHQKPTHCQRLHCCRRVKINKCNTEI